MKNINRAIEKAYELTENETPVKNFDCGLLCAGRCCKAGVGDSMELFPHEKELLEDCPDFTVTDGERPLVTCSGSCDRRKRPLACRIFPLFPLVEKDDDGKETVSVIRDPRAGRICPLCADSDFMPSRSFVRAVRRVGLFLMRDEECAEYLRKTSELISDLLILEYRLKG